ncbi:MAG: hypothetical protein ABGY11_04060 [Candidatus Thioglobus sp.]|jgi:hypothetical protein
MNIYTVEVDVSNVYRTEIEASDEDQAKEIALREAYEDTWSCRATHGGSEIYAVEEIEHEKADPDQGYDEYKETKAGLI